MKSTTKTENVLIFLDDTIADVVSNKKLNQIVTELLIRGRKLNISTVLITQTYFPVRKDVRQNCTIFLLRNFQTKKRIKKLRESKRFRKNIKTNHDN